MDQATSTVLAAGIAALAALSGSSITLFFQQRAERSKWIREQTRTAYSNALRALSKGTVIPIGLDPELIRKWFDSLTEVREALVILQMYNPKEADSLWDASNELFRVMDSNNYVLMATIAAGIEIEGDRSTFVLLGVGQ